MRTEPTQTETQNRTFYEAAYGQQGIGKLLIKQLISYDQLSKTRRNLRMAEKIPGYSGTLSVLDFGFGYGTFLIRLPRRHSIAGSELSSAAMDNLRALCRFLHRGVELHSPTELKSGSFHGCFDLICCSHVIEHVADDNDLFTELRALLRPNGHLLLNLPINEVWVDPNHVRAYTAESARQAVERAGIHVLEMQEADRWTAWILHHEYVAPSRMSMLFRLVRLALALLPLPLVNALERVVPPRFASQQLMLLGRKSP